VLDFILLTPRKKMQQCAPKRWLWKLCIFQATNQLARAPDGQKDTAATQAR
jgi:hypothetical protein